MASNQPTNLRDRLIKEETSGRTKFRSLKYDDFKGVQPNPKPFITTELPGVEEENPSLGLLGNGDFLLRAGSITRTLEDTKRLTKFFTKGQGAAFLTKQNLLSATNVKAQGSGILGQGAYLSTNTIAQAGVSAIGGHLLKQGLNPFRDLSVTEPTPIPKVGGDGFLAKAANTVAKGLTIADQATTFPLYVQQVGKAQDSGDNRLVQLRDAKISTPVSSREELGTGLGNLLRTITGVFGNNKATQFLNKVNDVIDSVPGGAENNVSPRKDEVLSYTGGPGAFLGIGRTNIKRVSDTTAYDTEEFRSKYYLLNSGQIQARADQTTNNPGIILQDFRSELTNQTNSQKVISNPVDYTRKNIEQRVGLGDPGTSEKNLSSYVKGSGLGPVDKVNSLPLYESTGVTANERKNDLVKFRIAAPDTNNPTKKTYIHFRAFLDGMVDNFTSNWNPVNYMGRTDSLYRFQNYNRSVVMSWTIAAQSREELMVMYTKLNYLQSIMAGDYTDKGYLAGNIINLTVGGYFWETPCIVNSMNITIPNESPWEIGLPDSESTSGFNTGQTIPTDKQVREMPHIIQVTGFSFTPIHSFAPRKQKNVYNAGGTLTEFGKQKFISLTSEKGKSIYDDPIRDDLQFNPQGFTDGSQTVNAITTQDRGLVDQNQAANLTVASPNEVNNALRAKIGLGF